MNFTSRKLSLFCALAVALGTVCSAPAATAEPSSDPKESTSSDTLPPDITGDATLSKERDRLQSLLAPLDAMSGGLSWDPSTKVLTVRMTSSSALDKAKAIIRGAQTDLSTDFAQVKFSANELNQLADRLLGNQEEWAKATGIGGGFDPIKNRVILQVDPSYKDSSRLTQAIEGLRDSRVSLELIEPVKNRAPESRVNEGYSRGESVELKAEGCGDGGGECFQGPAVVGV